MPSHLSVLLNTGWGISTETCGTDDVFVPDNLIGLFLILIRIVRLYMIYIWISLWCGLSFVYRCPTNWGRWPALSVQWLPCQYLLDKKWLMYGILFSASICSQWYLCVRLFFSLWITDLSGYHGPFFISIVHTILRKINRSVSDLVTDSHCVVWGRERTTCLMCSGPLLGLGFWTMVSL